MQSQLIVYMISIDIDIQEASQDSIRLSNLYISIEAFEAADGLSTEPEQKNFSDPSALKRHRHHFIIVVY